MKKITLLMLLAAVLTNGWAQSFSITTYQDCSKNGSITGTENGHAWVDLGLPSGLKWATCNVGAANPWDYGDYFAWGETADSTRVNMGGSWRMPTTAEQQELINNCYWERTDSYSGKGVRGYIVYKVKSASDKGKVKYSGSSTTTVGTYSLADPHIFLPAAGYNGGSDLGSGYYWSSSLSDNGNPNGAYSLSFGSDGVYWYDYNRYIRQSVRAVVE